MKLQDYLDMSEFNRLFAAGYINQRKHPTLPLFIYNYGPDAQFDQHWPHEVCACRGLIVDGDSNIISRPMYKFFNLGQGSTILDYEGGAVAYVTSKETPAIVATEDVMVDANYLTNLVRLHTAPLTITRKMDGQMGVLWNYGDQWGIATRGSFESDGAKFATEKWQKFVKYGAAQDFVPKGWTLIFEIIAKHLRIVIPYEWEGLCLLTAVNNETGEEMDYEQLHELWVNLNSYSKTLDADGNKIPGKPWCRIVEKFDIDIETAKNDKSMEEEGYVVSVNRSSMPPVKAKVKLAEYLRLHKILCNVTPQMIWGALAYPADQWLGTDSWMDRKTKEVHTTLPVPSEFAQWVRQWQRGIINAFHENLLLAINAVELLRKLEGPTGLNEVYGGFKNDASRKDWLLQQDFKPETVNAAMLLYKGSIAGAYESIWKQVRPHGKDERFYAEGKGE